MYHNFNTRTETSECKNTRCQLQARDQSYSHNLTLTLRHVSSKLTRDVSYKREISQASYLDTHTETGKLKTRDVSYKREISQVNSDNLTFTLTNVNSKTDT